MVSIREIRATDWLDQAWDLIEANREELTSYKDLMVLNPDLSTYERLEDQGAMLSLGAFDAGEIVGYSINILAHNLHYSDLRICQNDVLYLKRDYRQGPTGLRLMRETERMAKERGAGMMIWHAKPGTNLNELLPRMDYKLHEVCYSRVI